MPIAYTAALLLAAAGAPAVESDPLHDAAKAAGMPISIAADGSASGAGWDRLVAETSAAQFTLVGEQHAVADIVRLATTLQAALQAHGYNHAAYEVGPVATRRAERLIRDGAGKLEAEAAQRPDRFLYPFLGLVEEVTLARQIVERSRAKAPVLWGLDQEFIGAGRIVADRLGELARTDAQVRAVDAFSAAVDADAFLLGGAPPSTFDALAAAFGGGDRNDAEARRIVDEVILSNAIYAPFTGRGGSVYDANLKRETYMKTNFVEQFRAAEKRDGRPPRVFMKFGGNHMMRGLSTTDVQSLGNFISEWGHARGFASVSIMVDCKGGEQRDFRSGKAVPCESMAAGPGTLLGDAAADTGITLFDLRPLRGKVRRKSTIDAETRRAIFAFDYYIVIANPGPATMIEAR